MIRRLALLAALLFLVRPVAAQSITVTLTTCSFTGNAQPIQQSVNGTPQTVWAYMRVGDTWACSVNVTVAGDYAITVQATTYLSGQKLHFELPKGTTVGSLAIVGTGSWGAYQQQNGKVTLPLGPSTVLLVADGIVNLDNVLTLIPAPPSPTLIPPPPSPNMPNIMTVRGPLFWCTKCDGSDDKPVTGSLVVSQTGGGQVTVPINPDGTVGSTQTGAMFTVDHTQDPQEYYLSLAAANGVIIPGASLRLAFPQLDSLSTVSWSVARFTPVTDASGNPAAKVIIWSDLSVSK
jgi:hypothetical protein